jgi:hypothetical protein
MSNNGAEKEREEGLSQHCGRSASAPGSTPRVGFCWWCSKKLRGKHHVEVEVDGCMRVMHKWCNERRLSGEGPADDGMWDDTYYVSGQGVFGA